MKFHYPGRYLPVYLTSLPPFLCELSDAFADASAVFLSDNNHIFHSLSSTRRIHHLQPCYSLLSDWVGLYFWKRGVPLCRPLQPQQNGQTSHSYRLHHVGVCDICCGCGVCCGIEESLLPVYKLLSSSLVVAGGVDQVPLATSTDTQKRRLA